MIYARLSPIRHRLEIGILGTDLAPVKDGPATLARCGERIEPVYFVDFELPRLALAYASRAGVDLEVARFEFLERGLPVRARPCVCSVCGKPITEDKILRCWMDSPLAAISLEVRFHLACAQRAGWLGPCRYESTQA